MSRSQEIFSPRMRRLVGIAIALSCLATVIVILFGQKLSKPRALPRDSYTYGELGHRAFVDFLDALGIHTMRGRRSSIRDHRAPVFFIEPDAPSIHFDGAELTLEEALRERIEWGRASVIVLPKWEWEPNPLMRMASADASASAEILELVLPGAELLRTEPEDEIRAREMVGPMGIYFSSVPGLQRVRAADAEILLGYEGTGIVLRRWDGVIVVSDPDLLHSWSLHHADHAALWADLLSEVLDTDTVVIDEVFHGHARKLSLGQAVGELPAGFFSAHVVLLLLLLVLLGSRRFGAPLPPLRIERGPAEPIEVAAFVLAEGKPLAELGQAYVNGVIEDLADRLDLSAVGLHGKAQAIDTLAKRRGIRPRAAELLAEAARLDADSKRRGGEIIEVARIAHRLRTQLLGSRPREKR